MASKVKLLIADDDENIIECLQKVFEKNFEVFTAENGQIAFELQCKNDIKIVIADINMPEIDGTELCMKIQENDEECRIYALSSFKDMLHTKYPHAQFNGYLPKPFDTESLLKIIKEAEVELSMLSSQIMDASKNETLTKVPSGPSPKRQAANLPTRAN